MMNDSTQIIHTPGHIVPEKYQDRIKEDRLATQQEQLAAIEHDRCDKPIAIWLDAQELGVLVAKRTTPTEFNQELLRRFRHAGAPVEGMAHLKLAHGAIAKLKPDPNNQEMGFRYIWMPAPYVEAIASVGRR
jgi:Zn-finger nucleic acid-binding protein